jgi:hypothetical protein
MIKPGILPVDFCHGQYHKGTKIPVVLPNYEFYYPSMAACQLGVGHLSIKLYCANKLRPRKTISNCVEFNRIHSIE